MSPGNNNHPSAAPQPSSGAAAHPLDRYTAQPQSSDGGEKSPYYHAAAPSIALPKGGGALKGIDEQFSVNAANGTAGLSVPLPLTPGRGGFTPSLALSYNSGSGNSECGLGWSLGLPAIQRKTDRRLPLYNDMEESDVFLLAGAEDLVPLLTETTPGNWEPDESLETISVYELQGGGYAKVQATCLIKRYRPRTEGLFARIEHIRRLGGLSWWRVTTKDNITTWYGLSAAARLSAPDEPERIFKWMPELVTDGKGNAQHYCYKSESLEQVPTALHERNRNNGLALFTNLYLKKVRYCSRLPFAETDAPYAPALPTDDTGFLMELVLDYGEHDGTAGYPVYAPQAPWPARTDAFSDFHACFEIRTYRRLMRALMFHRFDEAGGGAPVLVRSLDLAWQHGPYEAGSALTEADYITSLTETGYKALTGGGMQVKSLPPITLDYQPLEWSNELKMVAPEDAVNAPQGLTGAYQWTDLWGEGLPGILTEEGSAWRYKRNLGDGHFTAAVAVAEKPSFAGLAKGTLQWADLDADGRRQVVSRQPGAEGYFELDDEQQWQGFRPFAKRANVDWNSPYTKMLDLDGDGRADVLIAGDSVWTWYENKGTEGYGEGGLVSLPFDEETGPRPVLNDAIQRIFLADMNGDGLTDIVRISNGSVCYWPNLGRGRFGAKVAMSGAPVFDTPDLFNPLYLQLTDVSGTGAPDLVYLGGGSFKVWINMAGNGFGEAHEIATLPGVEPYSKVALLDFLGNGTGCIVWSSPLPQHAYAPLRYIDLMGGKKPYLMHTYHSGMGKTTAVTWKPSTQYYLADAAAGTPWATRLPFPVQCIDTITTSDAVSETSYMQRYTYHHGYYDHEEREFRGFGRVDTLDTDTAATGLGSLDQSPVLTKTWYHTGAWMREGTLLDAYRKEYFALPGWGEPEEQARFPYGGSPREEREAHRALRGSALRQEIYAQDGTADAGVPYAITVSAYVVRRVQPSLLLWGGAGHAAFLTWGSESVSYSNERRMRGTADVPADIRVAHSLTLATDKWGNVTKSAQVAYPRLAAYLPDVAAEPKLTPVKEAQQQMHLTVSTVSYTNDVTGTVGAYRLRVPWQQRAYELRLSQSAADYPVGVYPSGGALWQPAALAAVIPPESAAVDYSSTATTLPLLRTLSHSISLYGEDSDPDTSLGKGLIQSLAIPYEQYSLAFTPDVLAACYGSGTPGTTLLHDEGGYVQLAGEPLNWWVPSGRARYGSTPEARFYQPSAFKDPWGGETTVSWWTADNLSTPYYLLPESVTDALGNTTSVTQYNWQTLQPEEVMDANENLTVTACDALGMPVAMALTGKGTEADYLTTLSGADILADSMSDASLQGVFWDEHTPAAGLLSAAKGLLGRATWRCIYRLDTGGGQPAAVAMIAREQHYEEHAASGVVIRISYSDGFGRVAMHKAQAADDESGNARWAGSGKTVYNNKGKAVLQYEPYFSGTGAYDSAVQAAAMGVSPELYYDPLGRLYKTIMPDGSSSHTEWDGWAQTVWDANDTIPTTWQHAPLSSATNGTADEADAYNKALLHKATPSMMYLDSLGRPFFTVQQHRQVDPTITGDDPRYYSYETLDIMGNRLRVTDANGHEPLTYRYNLLKSPCWQYSIDGGEGLMLTDVGGQPLWHRDAELRTHRVIYDELRRVVGKEVKDSGSSTTKLTEKTVYADGPSADYSKNLRGMVVETYDGGGKHYVDEYDFKGMPVSSFLQLPDDYQAGEVDWSATTPPALETQVFETSAKTDALGRMVTALDAGGYRTRHAYDKGGMLKSVYLRLPGATADDTYVQDIHYNAKGQRETIWYGNDTKVVYYYDDLTQRLRRQATRKRSGISAWTDLADVYYYYDAVGNITRIRDEAADTYFTGNTIIEPLKDYTYDSLYRLTKAKGREQISNATYGSEDNWNDGIGTANSNALQNYTQYYSYDGAGNILSLSHDGASAGDYTRNFNYASGTNRLNSTTVGSSTYSYTYDARGNMTSMPHLSAMGWNSNSELSMVVAGTVNGYYQYSGGNRIRKVIEKSGGVEERIYLGSYERYRKYDISGTKVVERDTVHIADDTGRIAMLEVRTEGSATDDNGTEQSLTRFIYSNHLQSSNLELNESGGIINYEEYHPYGTTAYQSKSATIKATSKRYRYTGKERDEESGLSYHGARYYAPWLCRWVAVDPLESKYAGWSAYQYCTCNPIMNTDSTGMGNDKKPTSLDNIKINVPEGYKAPAPIPPPVHDDLPPISEETENNGSSGIGIHLPPIETDGIIDRMNKITKKVKATWELMKLTNPIEAGVLNGLANFVTSTVEGIANMVVHPIDTLKGLSKISVALSPVGALTPIGADFGKQLVGAVKDGVDKFKQGDTYTRASIVTEGAATVASFFIGLGEEKAAATVSEIGNVAENTTSLFHFTNEAGYNAIMKSEELIPSIGVKNARYGPGQYLTDIRPGEFTAGQTSRRLFGVPWNTQKITHFIEIDVQGLNVIKNAPHNYLIPGETNLPLGGKILRSGISF